MARSQHYSSPWSWPLPTMYFVLWLRKRSSSFILSLINRPWNPGARFGTFFNLGSANNFISWTGGLFNCMSVCLRAISSTESLSSKNRLRDRFSGSKSRRVTCQTGIFRAEAQTEKQNRFLRRRQVSRQDLRLYFKTEQGALSFLRTCLRSCIESCSSKNLSCFPVWTSALKISVR